jgi:hypothetical protein
MMGVLPQDKSSSKYWPGCFEKTNENLDMQNNALFDDV